MDPFTAAVDQSNLFSYPPITSQFYGWIYWKYWKYSKRNDA